MTWRSFFLPKPRDLITRIAVLVGLLPSIGWIGGSFWVFDLFNHFQVQYAILLAICSIALLCQKANRSAAVAALLFTVPFVRIFPLLVGPMEKPIGLTLRFASFNVLTANNRYDDVVKWITETDPDVIFLPEADEIWADALTPLKKTHPHAIEHFHGGNFGFVFYSKLPILKSEVIPCGKRHLPFLKVRLQGPAGSFVYFGAHPNPPGGEARTRDRDDYLKAIAEEIASESGAVVVAGDLNATPWSRSMKPLIEAGLRGCQASATWQRGNPLLAIPIDQLLYRGKQDAPDLANCRKRWIGPDLGSDHRPIVAEIAW